MALPGARAGYGTKEGLVVRLSIAGISIHHRQIYGSMHGGLRRFFVSRSRPQKILQKIKSILSERAKDWIKGCKQQGVERGYRDL